MTDGMCKRCGVYADEPGLKETVSAYIASLPEDLRVSSVEYEKRLAACQACDCLINGLCSLCGCFAEARAAKKAMRCAKGADIW